VSLESWASSKKADIIVQVQKEFTSYDSTKSGVGTRSNIDLELRQLLRLGQRVQDELHLRLHR
jgi:hypothetical protein